LRAHIRNREIGVYLRHHSADRGQQNIAVLPIAGQ
jgi:hypothetical protein